MRLVDISPMQLFNQEWDIQMERELGSTHWPSDLPSSTSTCKVNTALATIGIDTSDVQVTVQM